MYNLFLDLSSHSTGWAVGDEKGKLLDYGCITSSSQNIFKRLSVMCEGLEIIYEKYPIQHIVAEEVRNDIPNSKTWKVLTWLQGIVLYQASKRNSKLTYELIQPSTWRSKIGIKTGRGIKREELKKADINYVQNKYGITANDDICDAICLLDSFYIKEKKCPWD